MIADTLLATLGAHGIEARVTETLTGPQVARTMLTVPVGTRVARVLGLSEEIEMALGVEGVSMSRVGEHIVVDVPRPDREFVKWWPGVSRNDGPPLTFFAGAELSGRQRMVDLAKAPHLLIAGSTGSGKSVALNTMLLDWLTHLDHDQIRLHLIDPKRVELGQYEQFPQVESFASGAGHLALSVVETVETIMDQRYEDFAEAGHRDIGEWNAQAADGETLPHQVLVIDEFADLMLGDKKLAKDIENAVVRIAQLGRAAGVHMVLATQRPTANVFTGLIKANVPARWVFRVNSALDSRIALDSPGAEELLGAGDSLLSLPGAQSLVRLQGASTDEADFDLALQASLVAWPDEDEKPPTSLAEPTGGDEADEASQAAHAAAEAQGVAAEPPAPVSDAAWEALLKQMLDDGEIDEYQYAEMKAEEF